MTTRTAGRHARPQVSPRAINLQTVNIRSQERQVQIVDVTPAMALAWLKANTHNRHEANDRRREEFKADMIAGNWTFSLDAIGFDRTGVLLNGQTRLRCLSETGVTLPFIVATGLDPADQDNMDLVRRRTMADQLSMAGRVNTVALASITAAHWRWMKYGSPFVRDREPTFAERREHEANHDFEEAIRLAKRLSGALRLPPSVTGPIIYEGLFLDTEAMQWFVERLCDGQALQEGDPIYILRAAYQKNIVSPRKAKAEHLAAWLIKGWNSFRQTRQMNAVSYKPSANEKYPRMV